MKILRYSHLLTFLFASEGFQSQQFANRSPCVKDESLTISSATREEMDSTRRSIMTSAVGLGLLALSPSPSVAAESKALSEEYRQGTAALADMDEQAPVPREAYKKLSSGVVYADLRVTHTPCAPLRFHPMVKP